MAVFSQSVINKQGDCMVVTLQASFTTEVAEHLSNDLLSRLDATPVKAAILDMSAVSIMDMHDFDALINLAKRVSLMGTVPMFAGFLPALVGTLATLGAHSHGIASFNSVETAISSLNDK